MSEVTLRLAASNFLGRPFLECWWYKLSRSKSPDQLHTCDHWGRRTL